MVLLLLLVFIMNTAAVYVGWPMDEQLPNVARVDQSYLFTLASLTYRSSSGGSITYSADNMPSWLTFDSSSRTFTGTPSSSDTSSFEISLTGVDSADNSTLTNSYEMLVSNSTGIDLSSSDVMFTQIAQFGQTNGADGLVVREGELFSVNFSSSVFKLASGAERPIIAHYGRSDDRTPLPNWVTFNADDLSFSGTVPEVTSEIAPSIEYGFSFIASDYFGFAGAEGLFKLVVGAHRLSTSLNQTIKINGTYGSDFDYTVPVLSDVYLDGSLIDRTNISTVYADNLPSFVSLSDTDYSLTGVFPNSSTFDNFTIVVEDVFGNLVELPYLFDSIGSVFTISSLPDVNATRGEYFQYQLLRSDFTDINSTKISVSFGSDSSWLSYDSSNMTISGTAPSNLDLVQVTVGASSSFDKESLKFDIKGVKKATKTSSSASSSATSSSATSSATLSSTSTSSSTPVTQKKNSNSNHKKLIIGLAVGIPCLVLVALLLLLLFCCARKRQRKDEEMSRSETEPELTGPGFGVRHDMDDHGEKAHQLGALNALKLDNDNESTLSSMTHVDSDNESRYFDASEKPMKSWRANDVSDSNAIKKKFLAEQKHASAMSMDTVNTEQLFSVRLVDDNSRHSGQSMGNPLFLSNSLNELLKREHSSGNVQRLDSDGNIAETRGESSPGAYQAAAKANDLNKIDEEDHSGNTFYDTTNDSSNYNLMARFFNGANSTSFNTSDIEQQSPASFDEDFRAVKTSVGNVEWAKSEENIISPNSETFLLDAEATPTNNATTYHTNYSKSSVYTNNSEHDNGKGGNKAKLMEFTRKGSLREAAREANVLYSGQTAQIHDGDSD